MANSKVVAFAVALCPGEEQQSRFMQRVVLIISVDKKYSCAM
jgi:hypothetical protein